MQFDFPDANGRPYKSCGGEMVWNEKLKRKIPKGWTDTSLGDLADMYQPKVIGLNNLYSDAPFKVYGANGMIGYYTEYNHSESEIAMACRGNSCGVINRTMPNSWITGNAMVIHPKQDYIHNEYLAQSLRYANVSGAITGSGQPQLTRENLSGIPMMLPNRETVSLFSQIIRKNIDKQIQIINEIDDITKLRDELLPLLMNGQVRVTG